MDLSSTSSISSSSVKESSSVSSRKISSSSISSSSVSSKVSSAMSSALSDIGSEMDDLLSSATGSARSTMSNISDRVGGALRSADLDINEMLSGTSLSSGINSALSSTSSSKVSSSSSKQVTKMSSISQSSMELVEGTGMEPSVKSSMKQQSSSLASTASLVQESKMVDGKLVKADTIAEKASIASQGQKEKVVEDGKVLVDTGSRTETTSAGLLKATKEMSQAELDSFFQGNPAIAGKPTEALNYDKDKNVFEATLSDLPEFSPRELTVKIISNVITVYGTHEEQLEGGGFKMHQYIRRFTVPSGLDNNIEWKLNPDGQLAIVAGDTIQGGKSQVHLDCTIFKPRSFFKKLQN